MARFVVRYRGNGPRPADAIDRVKGMPGARILEDAGRTLLVEGEESAVRAAFSDEALWLVAPELTYRLPDPRRKVDSPPE